jgi:hypothetical protein
MPHSFPFFSPTMPGSLYNWPYRHFWGRSPYYQVVSLQSGATRIRRKRQGVQCRTKTHPGYARFSPHFFPQKSGCVSKFPQEIVQIFEADFDFWEVQWLLPKLVLNQKWAGGSRRERKWVAANRIKLYNGITAGSPHPLREREPALPLPAVCG